MKPKTFNSSIIPIVGLLFIALSGCTKKESTTTSGAPENAIGDSPVAAAKSQMPDTEESWQRAKSIDSAKAYEEFLAAHPGSSHDAEARKALSGEVLIPFLGLLEGDPDAIPPLDSLKVSKQDMETPASEIFEKTASKIQGTYTGVPLVVNGQKIQLSGGNYDGNHIETVKYGKLRCTLAQSIMQPSGKLVLTFYLGGTRSQRDAVLADVAGFRFDMLKR